MVFASQSGCLMNSIMHLFKVKPSISYLQGPNWSVCSHCISSGQRPYNSAGASSAAFVTFLLWFLFSPLWLWSFQHPRPRLFWYLFVVSSTNMSSCATYLSPNWYSTSIFFQNQAFGLLLSASLDSQVFAFPLLVGSDVLPFQHHEAWKQFWQYIYQREDGFAEIPWPSSLAVFTSHWGIIIKTKFPSPKILSAKVVKKTLLLLNKH